MKKIIILFSCLISMLLFYYYYDIYNYLTFFKTEEIYNYIDNKQFHALNFNNVENSSKLLNNILNIAKQRNISVCYVTSESENGIYKEQNYIYTTNQLELFLKDKENIIDFSQNDLTDYYSSNLNDNNNYNVITSYNHKYFNSYQSYIYIYPFCQSVLHQTGTSNDILAVYVYTDDIDTFINLLDHNIKYEVEDITDSFDRPNDDYILSSKTNKLKYAFIISIISFIVAYSILTTKDNKKIFIYRLNGRTIHSISAKFYLPIILKSCLTYFAVMILLLYFFTDFQVLKYNELYIKLLEYFKLFLESSFLIFIIINLYIRLIWKYFYLDNSKGLKKILKISYVLKIILAVLMLPFFSDTVLSSVPTIMRYSQIKKYQTFIESCQRLDQVPMTNMKELGNQLMNIGYYANFKTYEFYSDTDNELITIDSAFMKHPFVSVNCNYIQLMENKIIDENGNKLNLKDLNGEVLLVPEKYKNENLQVYEQQTFGNYSIIYVKNTGKYININVNDSINELNNPILDVITNYYSTLSIFDLYLPINDNYTKSYYNNMLKEYNIDSQDLSYINMGYNYKHYIENLESSIMDMVSLISLYTFVYGLFLYQLTFIYILKNKKKISIMYMNGISRFERYQEVIIINICIYLLVGIISLLLSNTILETVIFVIFFTFIEIIVQFVIMYLLEKRSINNVLKGE